MGDREENESQQLWSDEEDDTPNTAPCVSAIGVFLGLVSGFTFGVVTVIIAKTQDGGASPMLTVFVQSALCTAVSIPVILYRKYPVIDYPKPKRSLLILNSIVEGIGRITLYFAYEYGLAGNVTSITFGAAPIITPIIARLALGDKWKITDIVSTVINIVGIMLVSGPSFHNGDQSESIHDAAISTMLSLITAIVLSISAVAIHSLPDVDIFVINLYVGVVGLVGTLPTLFISGVVTWTLGVEVWAYIVIGALCYLIAILAIDIAFQLENTATVVLLANLQICVAYVGGVLFLGQNAGVYEIIGSALIIVSSLVVAMYTWWTNRHRSQTLRPGTQ